MKRYIKSSTRVQQQSKVISNIDEFVYTKFSQKYGSPHYEDMRGADVHFVQWAIPISEVLPDLNLPEKRSSDPSEDSRFVSIKTLGYDTSFDIYVHVGGIKVVTYDISLYTRIGEPETGYVLSKKTTDSSGSFYSLRYDVGSNMSEKDVKDLTEDIINECSSGEYNIANIISNTAFLNYVYEEFSKKSIGSRPKKLKVPDSEIKSLIYDGVVGIIIDYFDSNYGIDVTLDKFKYNKSRSGDDRAVYDIWIKAEGEIFETGDTFLYDEDSDVFFPISEDYDMSDEIYDDINLIQESLGL